MIDVKAVDELRETRRRLAIENQEDVQRYAAMLAQVALVIPGNYVTNPLTSRVAAAPPPAKAS
jgi:hypothetical protein